MARTLAEIDADIAAYRAAEAQALKLQSFSHGNRSGALADLRTLRDALNELRRERERVATGTGAVSYAVPV